VIDVEVGDLTGDGLPDLVFTTKNTQGIIIYKNTPEQQFERLDSTNFGPLHSLVGNPKKSLLLFDVDLDGDLDLWTTVNNWEHNIDGVREAFEQVWINDGFGKFTKKPLNSTRKGLYHQSLLFKADLDLDGDVDVLRKAVGNSIAFTKYTNQGNGDFTEELTPFYVGSNFYSQSHLADFNKDGYPDIWVTYDDLHVYLNDQSGNFSTEAVEVELNLYDGHEHPPFGGQLPINPIIYEDIDGDGDVDIQALSDQVFFPRRINNGDGTFTSHMRYSTSTLRESAQFIDFDGDEDLDLWVSSWKGSVVWSTGEQGIIGSGERVNDEQAELLKVGDFDNDGDVDILSLTDHDLNIWYQEEPEVFVKQEQEAVSQEVGYIRQVRLSDINQDNNLDMLVLAGSAVKHRLGSVVSFGPLVDSFYDFELADFNNDGVLDIISSGFVVEDSVASPTITHHTGLGDGDYELINEYLVDPGTSGYSYSSADYDSDGHLDFLVLGYSGFAVFKNLGDDSFQQSQTISGFFYSAEFMDLSQSGDFSIIARKKYYDDGVYEYRLGDDLFEESRNIELSPDSGSSSLRKIITLDTDGDGDLDLLVPQFEDLEEQNLLLIENNTDSFEVGVFEFPTIPVPAMVSDFNQDGVMDFIERYKLTAHISGGGDKLIPQILFSRPYEYSSLVRLDSADIDFDGDVDLVTSDLQTGVRVWLNTLFWSEADDFIFANGYE